MLNGRGAFSPTEFRRSFVEELTAHLAPEKRKPSFREYAQATSTYTLHEWQLHLCDQLEAAYHQRGARKAIHAPPGVGKSVNVSQRFGAWCIGMEPTIRFYVSCYNVHKSKEHTRVIRDLLASPEHRAMFPDPDGWVDSTAAEGEFSTPARARNRDGQPSVVALGIRTGITGRHPDILIVDDPYASAEEASSVAVNDMTLRFFRSQVMGRAFEHTRIVCMFHRYHNTDVADLAINEYGFDYLRYPAVMDGKPYQALDWPTGTALSPLRPLPWIEKFLAEPGNLATYNAQYQGDVDAVSGIIINTDNWQWRDKLPEPCYVFCRGWDVGLTETGDPSAGVLIALGVSGTMYVMVDEHYCEATGTTELKRQIITHSKGDPGEVTITAVWRDTSSISVINDLIQDPFYTHPNRLEFINTGSHDKLYNASGWITRAEEVWPDGNKRLQFVGDPDSPRGKAFVSECRKWRNKKTDKDNRIDGTSAAFHALQGFRDTSHRAPVYPVVPGSDEYYRKLAGIEEEDDD